MRRTMGFISIVCLLIISVSCSPALEADPVKAVPGPGAPRDAGPGEIALFEEFLDAAKLILEAGSRTPVGVTPVKVPFGGFDEEGLPTHFTRDGYEVTESYKADGKVSSGLSGRFSYTAKGLHANMRKNGKILIINSHQLPDKGKTVVFYIDGVRYRYRIPSDS